MVFEDPIALTGWIGEHPFDGDDVAHLLLYPTVEGHEATLDQIGRDLGLGPATSLMVDTDEQQVSAKLAADGWIHLHMAQEEIAAIPVNQDWANAAARRGYLMLTLGQRAWDGNHASLNDYVADPTYLRMGLVAVTAN